MKRANLVATLVLTSVIAMPTFAGERRDLKKMCKNEYKVCRKGESRKVCRVQLKQCRVDNGVAFKDDLKWFGAKVKDFVKKAAGVIDVKYGVTEDVGEYLKVSFKSENFSRVNDFYFQPEGLRSSIEILPDAEGVKDLAFRVYLNDLEDNSLAMPLQTTEGRSFPKFIDGIRYESLFGVPFQVAGKENFQFYLDPAKKMVGVFMPAPLSGKMIQFFNDTKNKIKIKELELGKMIPDINSIPANIKVRGVKVGRFYFLAKDENGENSGVMLLFGIDELKAIAAEELAE